jgi:hypothetical protein
VKGRKRTFLVGIKETKEVKENILVRMKERKRPRRTF